MEFWEQLSVQNHDGDAFVAAVKVAVGTKFRAAVDGIEGILLEDTPFFTKNDAGDESFLFAAKQGGAQGSAKGAAFAGGAVAMDDFDGENTGLSGLAKLGKKKLTSFVDGGETNFDIENLECGHGGAKVNCA
jgi:hypothetical protein